MMYFWQSADVVHALRSSVSQKQCKNSPITVQNNEAVCCCSMSATTSYTTLLLVRMTSPSASLGSCLSLLLYIAMAYLHDTSVLSYVVIPD